MEIIVTKNSEFKYAGGKTSLAKGRHNVSPSVGEAAIKANVATDPAKPQKPIAKDQS